MNRFLDSGSQGFCLLIPPLGGQLVSWANSGSLEHNLGKPPWSNGHSHEDWASKFMPFLCQGGQKEMGPSRIFPRFLLTVFHVCYPQLQEFHPWGGIWCRWDLQPSHCPAVSGLPLRVPGCLQGWWVMTCVPLQFSFWHFCFWPPSSLILPLFICYLSDHI